SPSPPVDRVARPGRAGPDRAQRSPCGERPGHPDLRARGRRSRGGGSEQAARAASARRPRARRRLLRPARVPGGSLAADLARVGHAVYVMDVRGYGRSSRPPEMSQPPEASRPLVRSPDVVRDVAATVDWIRARRAVGRVALLGWATG